MWWAEVENTKKGTRLRLKETLRKDGEEETRGAKREVRD